MVNFAKTIKKQRDMILCEMWNGILCEFLSFKNMLDVPVRISINATQFQFNNEFSCNKENNISTKIIPMLLTIFSF